MKFLFIIFFVITVSSTAQSKDYWRTFYNSDESLLGFKDLKDSVIFDTIFTVFSTAKKVENIVAVIEKTGDTSYLAYHITRDKRRIGIDSVYFYDNAADCENEGFIRFHNKKTDKLGLLNRHGKVVVPAEYDYLSISMNGYLVALKGAEKVYDKEHKHSGCNHYQMVGGTTYLIDTNNRVVVKDFDSQKKLSFHSAKYSETPSNDSTIVCFQRYENRAF
ncbi:MAG: hypothetical protein IPO21_10970 [Bacteroidales bacterium]|nr:hypothetical protein [Bacteroidales bacterium]